MRTSFIHGLLLILCTAPLGASAGIFDGSKPLLCASIEAFECAPGDCEWGASQSVNFPQFLRVYFQDKQIKAIRANGETVTTKIQQMTEMDDRIVLQGVENGLGWAVTITNETGRMSLAASGSEVAFVIFGACTPL